MRSSKALVLAIALLLLTLGGGLPVGCDTYASIACLEGICPRGMFCAPNGFCFAGDGGPGLVPDMGLPPWEDLSHDVGSPPWEDLPQDVASSPWEDLLQDVGPPLLVDLPQNDAELASDVPRWQDESEQ